MIYTALICIYASIFYTLLCIDLYLRLKYVIAYADFLKCYSIFEGERCDSAGHPFEFNRNLIIAATLNPLNLHRRILLEWTTREYLLIFKLS